MLSSSEVQSIKVLKVIEEGRVGGPQMDILRTSPRLMQEGIDISVVIPQSGSGEFRQLLSDASIPVSLIPLTRPGKSPLQAFRYVLSLIPEILRLIKLIRHIDPEIIHVGGGSWQIKGVISGWVCKKRVIWHLNDTSTPMFIRIVFLLLRSIPVGFICAGKRVQQYYLPRADNESVAVIHSTVDCEEFRPRDSGNQVSTKIPIIVTLGNIGPVKGIEVFLQAIKETMTHVNVIARVIGEELESQKSYASRLYHFVKNEGLEGSIQFSGTGDVVAELQRADIYVCTSWFEASPTAVWEAMAVGKSVVSTDVGDVKEFIIDGVSGYIVEVGDATTLAEKIVYLLNNPEHAKEMGRIAREIALERLDVSKIVEQHLKLYRTVMLR